MGDDGAEQLDIENDGPSGVKMAQGVKAAVAALARRIRRRMRRPADTAVGGHRVGAVATAEAPAAEHKAPFC